MLENLEVDNAIRMTILNLMVVLYDCGIEEIHIGAVMRLLGVPNEKAALHDNERLVLDDSFVKYVDELNTPRLAGQSLH
jgi:hypothetical protein